MPKKFKVEITQTAQTDISAIWDHISSESPINAIKFLDELERKMMSLDTNPERQPVIPECEFFPIAGYRHLVFKKYRIVYRVQNEIVWILRVFHGSMLLDISGL